MPRFALANQGFAGYNTSLTTKRAGTNRPFFLVERFWSSKLSEKSLRGLSGFLFWTCVNRGAREVPSRDGRLARSQIAQVVWCFTGIELNTWHCSKSLNK